MKRNAILQFQSQYESSARTYPRRLPLVIKRASGLEIEDINGKIYLDCLSCAGALALGHNHPTVIRAVVDHIQNSGPWQTLDLMSEVRHSYIEAVQKTLPAKSRDLYKYHFCSPSGSDAVEAALKLTKISTGRTAIWAFHGGWHGQTHGSLSLMGDRQPKQSIHGLIPQVQFFPYPYQYRCPMSQADCSQCTCIQPLRAALEDPNSGFLKPAAIICELVQGEGGVIVPNKKWVQDLRRLSAEHQIPLVIDEVQTGWGRTGKMYAFEHYEIEPDVLILSKAIGGGLPLALILYRNELDGWNPGDHTGTFRGNVLAMVSGLATLNEIERSQLINNSSQIGQHLLAGLRHLKSRFEFIGDVRGAGLMIGIEIIGKNEKHQLNGAPPANKKLANKIFDLCFENGLICELGGRQSATLRLLPPINLTENEANRILAILEMSFQKISKMKEST